MDVSDDRDRRLDMDDIALCHEDFLGLLTDFLEYRFMKKLLLEQLRNACVQIERGHCSAQSESRLSRLSG